MRRRNMRASSLSSKTNSTPSSPASRSVKPSKYRAKKVEVDGLRFDSKKEAERYGQLKLLERTGDVQTLRVHPSFELKVNDQLICRYIADFSYYEYGSEVMVVEDVKGYKKGGAWNMFRLKAKLMKSIYGIEVRVV